MAPTAPQQHTGNKRLTARQKARARLADPLLPRKLHRENNVVVDSFINSKRDKRLIKHSAFVSRITKASSKPTSSSSSAAGKKRRRPSKKLVTTLESLGDALEDIRQAMEEGKDGGGDPQRAPMDAEQARQGKVRHRSLKTRPGALKRKERLVKGEMERFGRNLAQLANIAVVSSASASASSSAAAGGGSGGGGSGGAAADGGREKMDIEGDGVAQTGAQSQAPAQSSGTSSRWAALRSFISTTMEQNPAFLGKT